MLISVCNWLGTYTYKKKSYLLLSIAGELFVLVYPRVNLGNVASIPIKIYVIKQSATNNVQIFIIIMPQSSTRDNTSAATM